MKLRGLFLSVGAIFIAHCLRGMEHQREECWEFGIANKNFLEIIVRSSGCDEKFVENYGKRERVTEFREVLISSLHLKVIKHAQLETIKYAKKNGGWPKEWPEILKPNGQFYFNFKSAKSLEGYLDGCDEECQKNQDGTIAIRVPDLMAFLWGLTMHQGKNDDGSHFFTLKNGTTNENESSYAVKFQGPLAETIFAIQLFENYKPALVWETHAGWEAFRGPAVITSNYIALFSAKEESNPKEEHTELMGLELMRVFERYKKPKLVKGNNYRILIPSGANTKFCEFGASSVDSTICENTQKLLLAVGLPYTGNVLERDEDLYYRPFSDKEDKGLEHCLGCSFYSKSS